MVVVAAVATTEEVTEVVVDTTIDAEAAVGEVRARLDAVISYSSLGVAQELSVVLSFVELLGYYGGGMSLPASVCVFDSMD